MSPNFGQGRERGQGRGRGQPCKIFLSSSLITTQNVVAFFMLSERMKEVQKNLVTPGRCIFGWGVASRLETRFSATRLTTPDLDTLG